MNLTDIPIVSGLEGKTLRTILRELRGGFSTEKRAEAVIAKIAGVSALRASVMFAGLLERGLMAKDEDLGDVYTTSTQGNAVAAATAARPVRREKAEKHLEGLVARVRALNDADDVPFRVTRLGVFGSFITTKERVNDIDVAIDLAPRFNDHKQQSKAERVFMEAAQAKGVQLPCGVERLFWPRNRVLILLRARSHLLNFHTFDEVATLGATVRLIPERK